MERRSPPSAPPRRPEARRGDRGFGRSEAPAVRSEVPSPGRWIRPSRTRPSGAARTTALCQIGRPAPHPTPSGGGHVPTPDRSETPAAGSALKGVDNRRPVTEAVPVIARHDLRPLPSTSASDDRRSVSPRSRQGLPDLAAGDVCPNGSMNIHTVLPRHRARLVACQVDNASGAISPGGCAGGGDDAQVAYTPPQRRR